MKEINKEIKLTLNLMQGEIDDGAHGELQSHLYSLLEFKRNALQQRLAERSWLEPALGVDKARPLTADELRAGGWWCRDVSEECRLALVESGLDPWAGSWRGDWKFSSCCLQGTLVLRGNRIMSGLKQIHRIGNEFYWGEK